MSKLLSNIAAAIFIFVITSGHLATAETWGISGLDAQLPPCPKKSKRAWDGCIGRVMLPNGIEYVGEFRDGKPDGVGKFNDENRSGNGSIMLPDGSSYVGVYEHGLPNGQGLLSMKDGDVYSGNFKDGKLDGRGRLTKSDGSKYIGEFKRNEFDGNGEASLPDGDVYSGDFKNNKFDGQGTLTKANGFKYVGAFHNGSLSGQGTTSYPNGDVYSGQNENGIYSGNGNFTLRDGTKYVGELASGLPNGRGDMLWTDGTKYVGEFSNGELSGQGTYTWPNGVRYVGQFEHSRQHGYGTQYGSDNSKMISGEWSAGSFVQPPAQDPTYAVNNSTPAVNFSSQTLYNTNTAQTKTAQIESNMLLGGVKGAVFGALAVILSGIFAAIRRARDLWSKRIAGTAQQSGESAQRKPGEGDEPEHENEQESDDDRRSRAEGRMSAAQALRVLGLKPGATEQEIRSAYNRLIKHAHPDKGGSTHLAQQLNEAREVLLGNFRACA